MKSATPPTETNPAPARNPLPPRRASAQIRSLGIATLLLSLFGGLWMVLALNQESGVWLLACVLFPVSLLVLRSLGLLQTSRQVRALEPALTESDLLANQRVARRFSVVFATEVGAIVVIANLLSAHGLAAWTVAAIAVIAAASFLPLAWLLDHSLYYWTGAVELGLCAAIVALFHRQIGHADPLFGLVMGLTLWITVVAVLMQGARWGSALIASSADPDAH